MAPADNDWTEAFLSRIGLTSPEPIGLVVDRAEGCWLVTPRGERYIDLLAGIGVANVGHTHPRVVAAVEAQNRRHHHVMVYGEYVQEHQALYARELVEASPAGLDRVFFVNSGAEAVEGALKLARKATGRAGFAAFGGAYHGDTFGALSVAGNPVYQHPFAPLLGPVTLLPFGDVAALDRVDESVAAVIVEPVQGEGGVCIPPDEFLPALRRRCDATGALLVFDEVMTGFGRTGRLFAGEHWGVVPDVLVLAKALGGGYPLGGFLASDALLSELTHDPPLAHVTTFGGHPVSCAAGRAALTVIREEGLVDRSRETGAWFLERLRERLGDHPSIRDVRGRGMFLGIEFSQAATTRNWVRRCYEDRLLLGWTLHQDRVIRLTPALNTPREVLADAVEIMGRALECS